MLELFRMLDLSSRIYWYCRGRYEIFDSGNIPQPYSDSDSELKISRFDQLDELMVFACLPAAKIYWVCREILQKLIICDSSIRLNGRVLQKIETYFSHKLIAKVFATIPEQDLALAALILDTDFDTLIYQLAHYLFNHSPIEQFTVTKRFAAGDGDNTKLLELCQQVDFSEYLAEILPATMVASYPLIQKIITKKTND